MMLASIARKVLVCACLVGSFAALAQAKTESPAELELKRLANLVNNSIPNEYRYNLNASIERLRGLIENECKAEPTVPVPVPAPAAPICTIKRDGQYFLVKRGDTPISEYMRSSILIAADDHTKLAEAGLCGKDELKLPCTVNREGFYFMVVRDGMPASEYMRSSALTAADDMKAMAEKGLCQ